MGNACVERCKGGALRATGINADGYAYAVGSVDSDYAIPVRWPRPPCVSALVVSSNSKDDISCGSAVADVVWVQGFFDGIVNVGIGLLKRERHVDDVHLLYVYGLYPVSVLLSYLASPLS